MKKSPTISVKHEAYSILFSMLSSESRLVEKYPTRSELNAHDVDLDTAKGRRIAEAYQRALARAAKPIADYLVKLGDDLGTPFPYDE